MKISMLAGVGLNCARSVRDGHNFGHIVIKKSAIGAPCSDEAFAITCKVRKVRR